MATVSLLTIQIGHVYEYCVLCSNENGSNELSSCKAN